MEVATVPLEYSECGMDFVDHVQQELLTTNQPKSVPQYAPKVQSGPTQIENASVHLIISTLVEFASDVQQKNCSTQPSKDVNPSAILASYTILELTNADPNVVHSKHTHMISDIVYALQDTN